MNAIICDIETCSLPEAELLERYKPTFEPDKRLTDPAKIAADVLRKQAVWLEDSALHAERARIVCLGYRIDGKTTIMEGVETDLLLNFIDLAKRNMAHTICGHNLLGFDLPFLRKRCIINGLKVPFFDRTNRWSPWLFDTFDTMLNWSAGDRREMISLINLARALGIPAKDDGVSEQFGHIYATDKPRALKHLETDLLLTEQVYQRLVP